MFDILPVISPIQIDCGPTCMKMLLAYYGQDVPLEQLIRECNTGLAGCTMKDLKNCGNSHGLDMRPYRMDAEEVVRQDRPSICWWKYSHFIVCCGLDEDGKVVICDPDKGRYRMQLGTFKSFYTEAAIFNGEPQDLDPADEQAAE